MNADSTPSRRFEVALSFPGDHRDVVEPVASRLAERLGRDSVLYDEYHDAEFARLDLDVYLPGLYRTQSELVVIFLCPEYGTKRWCNLEWRHIRQLIARADAKRIMLLSIGEPGDLSDLGIVRGDGYIEISHLAPEVVADRILTRLYLNQGVAPPANPPCAEAISAGKSEPGTFWGWVESNSELLTVGISALAIAIVALTALGTRATGLALSACSIAAAGGWGASRLSSRQRITKALLDLADRNEIDRPGYFRVRPYDDSDEDQSLFDRADGAHLEILRWVRQSDEPVLFLSGTSGTGKSSLLYAYVLPRLRGDSVGPPAPQPDAGPGRPPPPKIQHVVLRNYDNPLALLAAEVRKLGVLQTPPPATIELRKLLQLAAQAAGGRLLVVLDQFEQLLITQESSPARFQAFISFLKTLEPDPITGVTFLIVLRGDRLGFVGELKIAMITVDQNLKLVEAFRTPEARRFVSRSGLKFDPAFLNQAVDQLSKFERIEGLIRPITLNMLGLALDRREPTDVTASPDVEEMLADYCRACMSRSSIRPYAAAIVRPLISRFEIIQPRTVADLSRRTKLRPGVVRGVLLNLGSDGLVRRIDGTEDLWEIAHDFVAHLLADLLRRSLIFRVGVPVFVTSLCVLAIFVLWPRPRATDGTTNVPPSVAKDDISKTPRSPSPASPAASNAEDVGRLKSVVVGKNVRISGHNATPRSESDIRIFYGNPQQIIASSDNPIGGQEVVYFSKDGGVTWGQTLLPLVEGDTSHSDPNVDWTSDGKAWALTIGVSAGSTMLQLRAYRSDDGGQTWAFDGTPSGDQTSADAPRMWVDRSPTSPTKDTIYAIWHNDQPAFVSRRTSSGWKIPIRVSGPETTGTAIGGAITTNADGEVLVVWPDTGSRNLFFVKSVNSGEKFSPPSPIARTFGSFQIAVPASAEREALIAPSIAAFRNDVYVAWPDLSGEADCNDPSLGPGTSIRSTCKSRIWFTRSKDGGLHWEEARRINDSKERTDQFNQRLAVDSETGVLGIIYYNTLSGRERIWTTLTCQVSTDHAASWSAPRTLTDDPTDETSNKANQYGDANGLSVAKGVFMPTWTDRRDNGIEAIFTAKFVVKDGKPEVIPIDSPWP
jgi:hypothetical protein